jgi:hypothetical protein
MLTTLQEKLAEAHGLAIGAATVVGKVEERVADLSLRSELAHMRRDADETRARCLQIEAEFAEPLPGELLAHANSTGEKAGDLATAWFKAGTGPLAAWTFLAMGEAGEVAAWTALAALAANGGSGAAAVSELAEWALPVQQRHLQVALEGAQLLGASMNPDGPRWG